MGTVISKNPIYRVRHTYQRISVLLMYSRL